MIIPLKTQEINGVIGSRHCTNIPTALSSAYCATTGTLMQAFGHVLHVTYEGRKPQKIGIFLGILGFSLNAAAAMLTSADIFYEQCISNERTKQNNGK